MYSPAKRVLSHQTTVLLTCDAIAANNVLSVNRKHTSGQKKSKQKAVIDGMKTKHVDVNKGIPQGTFLALVSFHFLLPLLLLLLLFRSDKKGSVPLAGNRNQIFCFYSQFQFFIGYLVYSIKLAIIIPC